MSIQPLLLGNGEHIEIEHSEKESVRPEVCSIFEQGEHSAYLITLFTPCIAALYGGSWVKESCSIEEFTTAFVLHAMAHIRYKSFESPQDEADSALFLFLDNLLEDARIEFCLMREFPGFATLMQYPLRAVREELTGEESHPAAQWIQEQLRHLYSLVRFGVAHAEMDQELLSLAVPLVLSATRGGRANALLAARTLERYLVEWCNGKSGAIQSALALRRVMVAVGAQPCGEQLLPPQPFRTGGIGDTVVTITDTYNDFVERTCQAYSQVIRDLRSVFRRLFSGIADTPSYEGDLPPRRQMAAYLSSLLGEERADYQVRLRSVPDTDVVLVGDVSGSTSDMQVPYAEAKVVLLAALAAIPGVYPSALDFSDTAEWVCRPGERLEYSQVGPRVFGGTQPAKALDLLERDMRWRGRGHLVLWITDGDWAEYTKSLRRVERLRVQYGVHTALLHCTQKNGGIVEHHEAVGAYSLWECSLETLPDVVTTILSNYRRMYAA